MLINFLKTKLFGFKSVVILGDYHTSNLVIKKYSSQYIDTEQKIIYSLTKKDYIVLSEYENKYINPDYYIILTNIIDKDNEKEILETAKNPGPMWTIYDSLKSYNFTKGPPYIIYVMNGDEKFYNYSSYFALYRVQISKADYKIFDNYQKFLDIFK